jgi:hypothetical protein
MNTEVRYRYHRPSKILTGLAIRETPTHILVHWDDGETKWVHRFSVDLVNSNTTHRGNTQWKS